jgi:hypothetical protein
MYRSIAVNIEGFGEIACTITLARELHDLGRFDIVEKQFVDTLCPDAWFENMWGVISSVFSGFYSDYDDGNEMDTMIFTDDVISEYYIRAWEFGIKTNTPADSNPYVKEAEFEARRWLSFTCNMGWNLLGYTKTRKAARKSRLIVYACACEFGEHDHLAYGLVQLYQFFKAKCAEFSNLTKSAAKEVMTG